MKLEDLKSIADDANNQAVWVTEEWAIEHFGSDAEGKFVATFSPDVVFGLIVQLENLQALLQQHGVTA